jgi:hypothetical protein
MVMGAAMVVVLLATGAKCFLVECEIQPPGTKWVLSGAKSKAWNKRYRIAVCEVKYAYCNTTLHSDLQQKK